MNLFSDASTTRCNSSPGGFRHYACFGVVAVNRDDMLANNCRLDSDCTTNLCELEGLRMSLSYVLAYINRYDKINIFSDSLYAVECIRTHVHTFSYKAQNNVYGVLCKSSGEHISNQSAIVECIDLYDRCLAINPQVRIFHQSGHVRMNDYNDVAEAAYKFKKFNNIYASLDLNVIRYISYFNDLIDRYTRSTLWQAYKQKYEYPVEFLPMHDYRNK